MARQVYIRPFDKEKDAKLLVEWLYANREQNRFDPELFKGDRATIYVAFDETGILGFIPVARCYLVESLAFKPGTSPQVRSQALRAWQEVFIHRALEQNIYTAFFGTYEQNLLDFAVDHSWSEEKRLIARLKFSELEKKTEAAGNADNDQPGS